VTILLMKFIMQLSCSLPVSMSSKRH